MRITTISTFAGGTCGACFICLLFFLFVLIPPPPISTLFPYTTLFRSYTLSLVSQPVSFEPKMKYRPPDLNIAGASRSEEHTSELQSRPHLVCRLLLEKKNTGDAQITSITVITVCMPFVAVAFVLLHIG